MIVEGEPGEAWEDQERRGRGTKVMVVEGQPREDQGDHGWKEPKDTVVGTGETPVEGDDQLEPGGNPKMGRQEN